MTMIQPEYSNGKISFEDYLKRYANYEGGRTEWLDGEVMIYPMGNNLRHQKIILFLAFVLEYFLDKHGLGELVLGDFTMRLAKMKSAREPDLLVVLNEHLDRIQDTHVNGVADIVIEVVSPESVERDRGIKLVEYENAGVPEYWVIDPIRAEASVYCLSEDGTYRRLEIPDGILVSKILPNFRLDVALLWRETPPKGAELVALVNHMGTEA